MGMSEKSTPGLQPKKLMSLDDLVPEKQEVKTSLGTVYVRHPAVRELAFLEGREDLGDAVLRLVVGRSADKADHTGLPDKDFAALKDADIALLVPAAIRMCGWPPMPGAVTVNELGVAARAGLEAYKQKLNSLVEGMRKKIEVDYSFLGREPLDRLKDQMSGLAALRTGVGSSFLEGRKETDSPSELLGRATGGSMHDLTRTFKDGASIPPGVNTPDPARMLSVEQLRIPRPEDSPIGRATLQTAQQISYLVEKMDKLADIAGGLNQTLVADVLPAWFKEVESGQEHAQTTIAQAAAGLRWAKWALVASVVATLLTAGWQVWVALEIDRENTALQERTEAVLREQLKVQQALIEQQARDADALRQALGRLEVRSRPAPPSRGPVGK